MEVINLSSPSWCTVIEVTGSMGFIKEISGAPRAQIDRGFAHASAAEPPDCALALVAGFDTSVAGADGGARRLTTGAGPLSQMPSGRVGALVRF